VGSLVALHVQQGVSVVDEAGSVGAVGHLRTLAVPGDEEAVGCGEGSWRTGNSLRTVGTRGTGVSPLT